mmetsp:Transcript_151/g.186  ORF Transcript_151/g.186 Transcript_151/m.186 type:complete len:309 (+) Transcript_151:35-961(+)
MKSQRSKRRLASPKSSASTRRSTSRDDENEVAVTTLKKQLRETQARLKLSSSELAKFEVDNRDSTYHYQVRVAELEDTVQRQQLMIKELHFANAQLGKKVASQPTIETLDELWNALQEVEQVINYRAARSLKHLASVRKSLVDVYKVVETQVKQSAKRGVVSMLNKIEDSVEALTELLAPEAEKASKITIETKSEPSESTREMIASPINRVLCSQEERIKKLEQEKEVQAETLKKLQDTMQEQLARAYRLPSPTRTIQFQSPVTQALNERIAKVYFSSSGDSQLQEQISALDDEIVELQNELLQNLSK